MQSPCQWQELPGTDSRHKRPSSLNHWTLRILKGCYNKPHNAPLSGSLWRGLQWYHTSKLSRGGVMTPHGKKYKSNGLGGYEEFCGTTSLAVTWNQLEAFSANWTLYKEAGKYLSMYPAGFLRRDLGLWVHAFWLPLSHRQGSGERRFVLFSPTFFFLLPTHFPVPLQHSSFSCCCESVCACE